MNGDEGARDQLRREMAAAGEQMGNTALEGRQHLYYFVIGGGNVVAWGDYLRTYLSILKKNPRGLGQYRGGAGLSGGEAWGLSNIQLVNQDGNAQPAPTSSPAPPAAPS